MKKNEGINVDARIEFYLKDNRWKLFLLSISLTKRALIYFKNAELDVVQAEVAEKLETELATAQQRIKELEVDGRRLDWLEESHRGVDAVTGDDPDGNPTRRQWAVDGAGIETWRGDIRAAIDAAMSRELKEGEAK